MGAVLREQINEALKEAMKARDQRRVSTLRLVNAALKDRDIAARGEGKPALADEDILGLMQKLTKQRQESLEIYEKAGRTDLATQEREEIEIISGFMPKAMSEAEADAAIAAAIKETGAAGMKDMGKVMALLRERHAGKLDIAKASAVVKGRLAT
jgi:uncharacterized protein YqeY